MSKHLERLAYADGQAPPTLGIIFNVIEILTHTQTIEVIKSTIEYFLKCGLGRFSKMTQIWGKSKGGSF